VRPRVSLVVPNKNNEPALDLVFERLAENTTYPDFEVVVVDDGSTDRSREILRRWRDSGRFERFVYEERPPSGVVVTLNRCLELASGELCVQLDADATVETRGWLETMVDFFTSDPRIGVVSPRVVFDFGAVHAFGVNIVGPEGLHDRGSAITEPAGRRTRHDQVDRPAWRDAPYGDRVAEVDSGIGCCMLYRREDALAAGGYDMGFQPVWFDDLDLALSIRHRCGKKAFFLPDVLVVHRVSLRQTRGAATRREVFEARVGRLLPPRVKEALKRRAGIGGPPPEILARLEHHYGYWREKWGWDLVNPDVAAIRERYAGTEVVWAYEEERRRAGQEIAERWERRDETSTSGYAQRFLRRFGFLPPPSWTALTPYDHILDVLRSGLPDGDVVEIGAFLGGGVAQLAQAAPERRVVGVDVFAPEVDDTEATDGRAMQDIYGAVLGEGDQRELYDAVTAGLDNVVTVAGDSAEIDLPTERIAFAHLDGNHDPAYVRGDFEKVWALTVPGGVVAFDDYGFDLPQVTETIDALRAEHADEIAEFWVAGRKTAFLRKR
jgi:glycosyltransferase involved in cell wall biosynthesis